jgi:glucan biosynthesis protein C
MKERRYDIDWLRVIAMLGVFIFHCTRFFDNEDWHLKAPPSAQSDILPIVRDFIFWIWLMEIFFLLAGFATQYSLRRRTVRQYLGERVKRLIVPLYTVGMFLIVPPQAYFERLTHGQITGTFWQWLPGFYLGLPREIFSSPVVLDPGFLVPYTFVGHLWFLQILLVIVVATLPLILFLKSKQGLRLIDRMAGWSTRPGGIFFFVVPLAFVQVSLRWLPETTARTWADLFWYALYFIIGYVISSDDRFTESIKRNGWTCLILWIVLYMGAGTLFRFVLGFETEYGQGFSLGFALWQIVRTIISWSAIVFILSLGAKYLNFTNKLLVYSNEAVLPFYILHQTIILIVGWFVLPWDIGNLAKFLIIAVVSFILILLLYEVFVRRISFMRFLFGMTPKKKQPVTPGG